MFYGHFLLLSDCMGCLNQNWFYAVKCVIWSSEDQGILMSGIYTAVVYMAEPMAVYF